LRVLKTLAASFVFLAVGGVNAVAQTYPERQVFVVVSSAAGSSPDHIARLLQPKWEEFLKKPIVVENRVGANGIIAVDSVMRAQPDGHTVLIAAAGTYTVNPFFYPQPRGDAIISFKAVSQIALANLTLAVRATLNVKTCPDLLALMRKNPGKLNFATSTPGTFTHLAAELFKRKANVEFVTIPHAGAAAAVNSVAGGHTDIIIEATAIQPFLQSGQLVALATTGGKRDRFAPELMTLHECGATGFDLPGWVGAAVRPDTPDHIVQALYRATRTVVEDSSYSEKFRNIRWDVVANTPEELTRIIVKEREEMRTVIQQANIISR
jgi:tripartite-type tricarboxylate transporter receptor subunit TctC